MKSKISFILVFILVFVQITPVYAAVATDSNAAVASSSNADEIIEEEIDDFDSMYESLLNYSSVSLASASDADYGIMLLGSETPNIQSVTNTVSSDDLYFELVYVDQYDVMHYPWVKLDDERYGRIEKPSDFASMVRYGLRIDSSSLPPSGNYKLEVGYRADVGGVNNSYAVNVMYGDKYNNAVTLYPSSGHVYDFDYYMGDLYFSYNVQVTGDVFYVMFYSSDTVLWPFGGTWNVRFTRLASDADVDLSNPYYSSTETQDSIANSSIQIAENTASIGDTLKELIVHISDQLAALWDQMYNYMHLPQLANDDKNTQLIVDTLQDGLSVEIENQDDNTEEIINGYDNSEMQSSNSTLQDTFDGYTEQEDQVLDQISEPLASFEFDNPVTQYLATFRVFGDFLQDLYDESGNFKDVIRMSFILGIALMVAGLYRFKGGN